MTSLITATTRRLVLASAPALLGACTMVGGAASRPGPASVAAPAAAPTRPPAATRPVEPAAAARPVAARVVDVALESIGTPYVWGGTSEDGFDCSGLIQFAYAEVGVRLPRVSRAQIRSGSPVMPDPSRLRPGDILGFSDDGGGGTDHVGLYVGGGEFIHSGSSGVQVSNLENPYWRGKLVAARRIVG